MTRPRKIGHRNPGRVPASSRSAAYHDGNLSFMAKYDQPHFIVHDINCIDDEIEAFCKQLCSAIAREELSDGPHVHTWIDRPTSLGQHFRLHAANRSIESRKLPVHVANTDFIQVDQGQPPNPRPSKRLDRPRADASQANHGNMRPAQPFETVTPV